MTCFRTSPIFKAGVGTSHIDVQEDSVWFEGWYGRACAGPGEKASRPHRHYQFAYYRYGISLSGTATKGQDLDRSSAFQEKLTLRGQDMLKWEFTAEEAKKRERVGKASRLWSWAEEGEGNDRGREIEH
ncbi:hypothetical protein EJ02DRAFT_266027 [Clathrospora elynae]|uniref:Uncharacterized protein n=1 Tax=Clathrospora elynae TaxID=706981 RepID=A0A6A5SEM8_9PLEO|nr:hypothetical protein EJ02DRAFT_266027 [Clathrospora elynae]